MVVALDRWAAEAAGDGLRRVPAASLHVTLAFLGERREEEAEAVGDAVAASAAPVAGLGFGERAWLPPRRPGVLAVDLVDGDGACGRVQAAVAAALVKLGAFAPERRQFRPHVTVARVRRGARPDPAARLPALPDQDPFAATALTLYRSVLGGRAARYDALRRVTLTR